MQSPLATLWLQLAYMYSSYINQWMITHNTSKLCVQSRHQWIITVKRAKDVYMQSPVPMECNCRQNSEICIVASYYKLASQLASYVVAIYFASMHACSIFNSLCCFTICFLYYIASYIIKVLSIHFAVSLQAHSNQFLLLFHYIASQV